MPAASSANYTSEVRFAVVMYGGVSLAIYINGIAQELLRLVRATAEPAEALPQYGTERIYREISYRLASHSKGLSRDSEDQESLPPTRFVVDILSGTSAGGINAIFLAKALANRQDMEQLKELWIKEGDIESLINDWKSIDSPLTLQDPPPSLLNSERMYWELLKAFDGMEPKQSATTGKGDRVEGENTSQPKTEQSSPYVDELDLFVTSTDFQGVVLPIRLADGLVYERRHRNVLHFVYSHPDVSGEDKPRNDFEKDFNPFLAYAARCTSSFPFAFEPMCLCDADKILDKHKDYRHDEKCRSSSDRWQRFYRDYLDPRGVSTIPFPHRAFGDGGYLDNKPFSYATETLASRSADLPVDRKLIYIEPSPEHPEDEIENSGKPDAIDSLMAALNLPRYETIREDLQRVMDRNRLIERVNRIIEGVDRDQHSLEKLDSDLADADHHERWRHLGAFAGTSTLSTTRDTPPWAKIDISDEEISLLDLADMIKRKGRAYASYHRLRIATVTDDLARLFARAAGFDENSDYFLIIRSLVRAWRDQQYIEYRSGDDDQRRTMNRFLFDFDLAYPLRRVRYLRSKIDKLFTLDDRAMELVDRQRGTGPAFELLEDDKQIFRETLVEHKEQLNSIFISLRCAARTARARRRTAADTTQSEPSLRDKVNGLMKAIEDEVSTELDGAKTGSPLLEYFLSKQKPHAPLAAKPGRRSNIEDECTDRAVHFLETRPTILSLFDQTAEVLKAHLKPVKASAEQTCYELFTFAGTGDGNLVPTREDQIITLARNCVGHYYRNYEDYDLLTYPILYDTDVGEPDLVEILRVSPEDAKQLIDERATGCHKLAGTALGHFGAFLEKLWRQNDILWGRLDGAERLITALLPDDPVREQLIGEAQAMIVCETIECMGEDESHELLAESLMRTRKRKADPQLLDSFIATLKRNCEHNPELKQRVATLIDERKLRQFYVDNYERRSGPDPEATLRSAARATTVVGKMLAALSTERRVSSKYAMWIARVGQIFWALVEISVPRSFPHLVFRHWLKLLYFLEALLIALSTLLVATDTQKFALMAFVLTAAVHLAVVILGDLFQSNKRWVNIAKVCGGLILVLLIGTGLLTLAALLGVDYFWRGLQRTHDFLKSHNPLTSNATVSVQLAFALPFFLPFLWAIREDLRDWLIDSRPAQILGLQRRQRSSLNRRSMPKGSSAWSKRRTDRY